MRVCVAKKRSVQIFALPRWILGLSIVCESRNKTTLLQEHNLHGCSRLHHRVTSGYKLSSFARRFKCSP